MSGGNQEAGQGGRKCWDRADAGLDWMVGIHREASDKVTSERRPEGMRTAKGTVI